MKKECIVTTLVRWQQVSSPTVILVIFHARCQPVLHRERRIGYAHIKSADHAILLELWVGQSVTHLDVGTADAVKQHVQLSQCRRAAVLLLSEDRHTGIAGFCQGSQQ